MKFFKIVLLCVALTQFKVFAQEIKNVSEGTKIESVLTDETEKWQFIEKYFAADLNTLMIHQKFGKFLNNYSSYISGSLIILETVFVIHFFEEIGLNDLMTDMSEKIANTLSHGNRKIRRNILDIEDNVGNCVNFLVLPAIIYLITNKILNFVGKKLENKDGRCHELLNNYVKDWEKNKKQTPTALKPMFDKLATHDGISKIDKALAQKIVETIIATSLIANSIA